MTEERIVLVDQKGNPIGTAEKLSAHTGQTPLHLAFSCYIFNDRGEFLITKRARSKKVWPGVWTNSCCGHPAPSEPIPNAIERRVSYELGMHVTDIQVVLPRYTYKTPPFNGIIEHEFCPVFVARAVGEPVPNLLEVESWKWVSWSEYIRQAQNDKQNEFSWWTKDQLKQLVDNAILLEYAKLV